MFGTVASMREYERMSFASECSEAFSACSFSARENKIASDIAAAVSAFVFALVIFVLLANVISVAAVIIILAVIIINAKQKNSGKLIFRSSESTGF